jgi:AraC family transcriptional regulator
MDKNASPKAIEIPQMSLEPPFTTFIQLDGRTPVPSLFRTAGTFTITRLQSPAGLPDRITKQSPTPALLVSISLKSLPPSGYQVWTADKLIATSIVRPFRSNVIDFDSQPSCWAGNAFDYVHYSVPRKGLDDIAEDFGFGRVSDYRLAVLEDDLVVAQITKSILPFLGRNDHLSVLALDRFSLILGAHLIQRYGVLQKAARHSNGGLAPWQKRRASELLHESMHGRIRLSDVARECGLSVSHFARSFKTSFGTSAHQWLILGRNREWLVRNGYHRMKTLWARAAQGGRRMRVSEGSDTFEFRSPHGMKAAHSRLRTFAGIAVRHLQHFNYPGRA